MKYFVPDSVANAVHENEIDDKWIVGLPLVLQVAIIKAHHDHDISGQDCLAEASVHQEYQENDGTGILAVNTDRDHWYGVVMNPADPEKAKAEAEKLLSEWVEHD